MLAENNSLSLCINVSHFVICLVYVYVLVLKCKNDWKWSVSAQHFFFVIKQLTKDA